MIKTAKLLGIIVERGLSQKAVAKKLGINEATFYRKMKRGVFDSDEIYGMIKYLGIENPTSVFFTNDGTQSVPEGSEINV